MQFKVRFLLLISMLFTSVGLYAVGFTPTEGGLVVDLKKGNKFLLSTMIDDDNNPATPDVEYFVCHYDKYTGGHFKYTSGNTLKLIPMSVDDSLSVVKIKDGSSLAIWTVDTALASTSGGWKLDGVAYTMWSKYGYTIQLDDRFKTQGKLSNNKSEIYLANVVFVVPTRAATTSFDPNNTMGKGTVFSAEKGIGFLGMPFREVYWMDFSRSHEPRYINAAVVSFNTTQKDTTYAKPDEGSGLKVPKGQAIYAFADKKHKATKRTLFRLYVLDETTVSACPESKYYFAYSQRFTTRYRKDEETPNPTYTGTVSYLTMDRLTCMDSIPGTEYWQTDLMTVPDIENARYYVGYKNHFPHMKDKAPFEGQYTWMDSLPLQHLPALKAPKGALGRMVVDTNKTDSNYYKNLDGVYRTVSCKNMAYAEPDGFENVGNTNNI